MGSNPSGSSIFPELSFIKLCIQAFSGYQFGMRTAFDDLTAVDDQDQVGCQDGAEAMGDNDAGALSHDALQGFLDELFRFAVQAAGGFIQHQDLRVFEDDPRQCQALLLSAAKRYPRSPTMVLYRSGRSLIKWWMLAIRQAASISVWVAFRLA